MASKIWVDRFGAFSGVGFVVATFVGSTMSSAGGSQSNNPTGAQALSDLRRVANSTGALVGMYVEILGFALFAVFVGYLFSRLRAADGGQGWLAPLALAGGVATLAVKLASGAPLVAGMLGASTLSPDNARLLADLNNASFVISWVPFGLFLIGAGLGSVAARLTRPLLGWIGAALGVLSIAAITTGGHGFVDANPLPFLLGLLWVAIFGAALGLRRRRAVEPVVTRQAVPATV
jgi:hypothetical protein